jgi:hypothetical protein
MTNVDLETAVNVFVESFSYVHNMTQPCEVIHHEGLRIIKNRVDQSDRTPREEIIVPLDVAPGEVMVRLRAYQPTGKHILDVFQRPEESWDILNSAYLHDGYHHIGSKPLMAIELPATFTAKVQHNVHRVRTKEQAAWVVKNARLKLIMPEHLSESSPSVRLYYVEDAGKVVAWGRSTQRHPSITYVAGMWTNQAYSRRGIATAILKQMLDDDAAQGATHSILLSSHEGYALYQSCGYEQIGMLQMFGHK